jgi:hypothetical protein
MFAGLPGTGIGGIFYLLLTIWMPFNELYLTLTGRSSVARWVFVLQRVALFGLVIAVMWGQVKLLKGIFPQGAPQSAAKLVESVGMVRDPGSATGVLLASGIYAGMVMLMVLALMHGLRAIKFYRGYIRDLLREVA